MAAWPLGSSLADDRRALLAINGEVGYGGRRCAPAADKRGRGVDQNQVAICKVVIANIRITIKELYEQCRRLYGNI